MGHAGEGQRRAQRDTFSTSDRDEPAALALALPDTWMAAMDTHGQIAILPTAYEPKSVWAVTAYGHRRTMKVRRWWLDARTLTPH
jgi:hypothetical protein